MRTPHVSQTARCKIQKKRSHLFPYFNIWPAFTSLCVQPPVLLTVSVAACERETKCFWQEQGTLSLPQPNQTITSEALHIADSCYALHTSLTKLSDHDCLRILSEQFGARHQAIQTLPFNCHDQPVLDSWCWKGKRYGGWGGAAVYKEPCRPW